METLRARLPRLRVVESRGKHSLAPFRSSESRLAPDSPKLVQRPDVIRQASQGIQRGRDDGRERLRESRELEQGGQRGEGVEGPTVSQESDDKNGLLSALLLEGPSEPTVKKSKDTHRANEMLSITLSVLPAVDDASPLARKRLRKITSRKTYWTSLKTWSLPPMVARYLSNPSSHRKEDVFLPEGGKEGEKGRPAWPRASEAGGGRLALRTVLLVMRVSFLDRSGLEPSEEEAEDEDEVGWGRWRSDQLPISPSLGEVARVAVADLRGESS